MKLNRFLYSSPGFISLLGFIGLFEGQRIYLCFFAFAIHLKYFFIKPDEMLEAYMNKSASVAFYIGTFIFTLVVLFNFFVKGAEISKTLLLGFPLSWITSILIYSIMLIYYEVTEGRGIEDD